MSLLDNLNIYADIASNHHGDRVIFNKLIMEIEAAGAIPKIQLWSPETFPRTWVDSLKIQGFVPSVFRPADVDFILPYKPLALKVASVESTYWDLIQRCLETDLPLIVSTGGMNEDELMDLIELVGIHGPGVCLMHCISNYPTKLEDLNLLRLTSIGEAIDELGYEMELGWSSHYPYVNPKALTMAYCYGSTQFEIHVRHDLGFEHKATLDEQCALLPSEIKLMRGMLEDMAVIEGSENIVGPDRDFVVKHRSRWQSTSPPSEG